MVTGKFAGNQINWKAKVFNKRKLKITVNKIKNGEETT
jgi:hypothetical protein